MAFLIKDTKTDHTQEEIRDFGLALLKGKTLQYLDEHNEWQDSTIHNPTEMILFMHYGATYRIKPT